MPDPKVLVPENYNMRAAAIACGCDAGVVDCPVCSEFYHDYGGMQVLQCVKCDFVFPVDWWTVYHRGVTDGRRIAAGGSLSGGMRLRMGNPYYLKGFNTLDGDPFKTKDVVDWKKEAGDWTVEVCESLSLCSEICERCGNRKDESRKNRSGECIACEAETECVHRTSLMEKCCKAGVVFNELRKNRKAGECLPCYYNAGMIPMYCPSFANKTVAEIEKEDEEVTASILKFAVVSELIGQIKNEYKGIDWSGVQECPVCGGRLHMSHAAYNGHVHGRCETSDCLNWME